MMSTTIDKSKRRASRIGRAATLVIAAAVLLTLVGVDQAHADEAFCPPGQNAGECMDPQGVAVNEELERLYLVNQDNRRIEVFDAASKGFLFAFGWGVDTGAEALEKCTIASGCQEGKAGSGAGQLSPSARSIAIDNVEGSLGKGNVYVFNGGNLRVEVYDPEGEFLRAFGWGVLDGSEEAQVCTGPCLPGKSDGGEGQFNSTLDLVAVGPGGAVNVADTLGSQSLGFEPRVLRFDHEGGFLGEDFLDHADRLNLGFAVDPEGDIYAAFNLGDGIYKFEPDGTQYAAPYPLDSDVGASALAVDAEGELFSGQQEKRANSGGTHTAVGHYDSEGNPIRRYGYGSLQASRLAGLTPFPPESGNVFANDSGPFGLRYLEEFLTPGPIVVEESLSTPTVSGVWAQIESEVNPEGKATDYRIEYVDQLSYETEGGFESPNVEAAEATLEDGEGEIAEDFRVHGANLQIGCNPFSQPAFEAGECLSPDTEYRYRAVAEDEDGAEDAAEGTLTTTAPLEVEELYAVDAGSDRATLRATVNPLGNGAVSGHFEYVELSEYEATGFEGASQTPDVGGGEAPLEFGAGEAGVTRGASATGLEEGTTYRYRVVLTNPFETFDEEERTVSTLRSTSSESCPANAAYRTGPSALLPDCRAYELVSPLDKEGGDIKIVGRQFKVLEQSSLSGDKVSYGSYRSFGDSGSAPYTSQYLARRDAGAGAWLSHGTSPREDNLLGGLNERSGSNLKMLSPDLCEGWIRTFAEPPLTEDAVPGYYNLYRQVDPECGGLGAFSYEALTTVEPPSEPTVLTLEFQGATEDGKQGIYLAEDELAEGGAAGVRQLYGVQGGVVRFLCVLPDGSPHSGPCTAGRTANALPQFEQRSTVKDALSADGARLYWSDGDGAAEIFLRENPFAEGAECGGEGSSCTVAVSEDGEAMSGTTGSNFWAAAPDGSAALYTTAKTGVSDLYRYDADAEESTRLARRVDGVAGQSEDLRTVYFVSREEIEGTEGASEGEPNLYLYELEGGGEASYRFVATVSETDADFQPDSGAPTLVGIQPGFKSTRVTPDGEQIAFMSTASPTGYDNADARSGEPDAEVFIYDASAEGGEGRLICPSCNPSGARPVGVSVGNASQPRWVAAELPAWKNHFYAARALTEDGQRLFFESIDALVARDTNSRKDVYQWEAEGKGGCEATDPSYVPAAAGCVDLISSGQSAIDSRFLDASPEGDDVFFITLSSLVSQDYGLADVYDARVDGGLPSPSAAEPECEGEACQDPPPAPESMTPSSLAYGGPGNLAAGASPAGRCNRSARRAKRLSRRAKRMRRQARSARAPVAKRKRARAAKRGARQARRFSRAAKRCRARARNGGRR